MEEFMNLQPLHDRIIVKAAKPEEITKGGIIIPDTAKEKPMQGEIIAVGTGKVTEDGKVLPLTLKPGDKVLYGKYSGTEVTVDTEEYLMMREADVFAIIK
jgi:chaperonin GroES